MKCSAILDLDKRHTTMSEIEEGEIVEDVSDPPGESPRTTMSETEEGEIVENVSDPRGDSPEDEQRANVDQQTAPERSYQSQEITITTRIRIADDSTILEMYDLLGTPPYTYETRMIGQQGGTTDLQVYHLEKDTYFRVQIEELQHRESVDQGGSYVSQEVTNRIADNSRSLEGRREAHSDSTKASLLEKYFKARKRAKDIHESLKVSLKEFKTVAGDVKEVVLPEDVLHHTVNDLPKGYEKSGRMQIEKAPDEKAPDDTGQVPKYSELEWSPISRERDKGKKKMDVTTDLDNSTALLCFTLLSTNPQCSKDDYQAASVLQIRRGSMHQLPNLSDVRNSGALYAASPLNLPTSSNRLSTEDSQHIDFDASSSPQESLRGSRSSLLEQTPSYSSFPGELMDPIYASAVLSYSGAFPVPEVGSDVKHGTGASASTNLYWRSELWCGDLKVAAPSSRVPHLCYRILAYTPSSAKPNVREITRTLPRVLEVQEASRRTKFGAWPEPFQRRPPTYEDIALCFVPWNESVRMGYMELLNRMIALDQVLMGQVESADILIFPSCQLKFECPDARRNSKFLWGVFRNKNR